VAGGPAKISGLLCRRLRTAGMVQLKDNTSNNKNAMTFLRKIFILFILPVCINSFGQKTVSPIFDISPDNKSIVISIINGKTSTLFIFSLAENKLVQLTDANNYYSRPVYSPQGNNIICLSKGQETETSDLCSISLATKQITKLTDGKNYITEATFTKNGDEILYCVAGSIKNFSPMAKKAPHEIDLYSMKSDGSNTKKLTIFNAYQFSGITANQKGDTVLCKLVDNHKDIEGICLLSLSDTVPTKIEAVNNPRPEIGTSFYGTPAYSTDNKKISFTAPYQLYLLNLADKQCSEIWSSFGKEEQAMPIFSKFDGTQKIFFSTFAIVNRQYVQHAKIYSFDLITKKLAEVLIPAIIN
jgi:hypothetical protein